MPQPSGIYSLDDFVEDQPQGRVTQDTRDDDIVRVSDEEQRRIPRPSPRTAGRIAREIAGDINLPDESQPAEPPPEEGVYALDDFAEDDPTYKGENDKDAAGALVRDEHPHARTARLASEFLAGAWNNLNPIEAARSLGQAAMDPWGAIKGIGEAQGELAVKAKDAFDQGDYVTGLRHSLHYLLPIIGPGMDAAADKMVAGDVAEGAGEAVGIGLGLASPKIVPKSFTTRAVLPSKLSASEASAVAFGEARGVPIDAATATGRPSVRAMQKRVMESFGGESTADRMIRGQQENLTRVGTELADATSPVVTPQQAGESLQTTLARTSAQFNETANKAYDALRAAEADPKHATKVVHKAEVVKRTSDGRSAVLQPEVSETIGLGVNIADAKAALKPLYEREMAAARIAPPQGSRARMVQALDRLMNGPDNAPLSVVDEALGDFKALERAAQGPGGVTTAGGTISREIIQQLDAKVRARASQAGPEVIQALMDGRAATKQKYEVGELLETIGEEPVKAMRSLVAPKDSAIVRLKALAKAAPDEMPKIGRAYLEDLLSKATENGRFEHAAKLYSDWQNLGVETKKVLFRKPELIRDLDHFFALAKKVSENPNPSGTASTLRVFDFMAIPGTWALSKLLYTPRGVKALTRGLQVGSAPAVVQTAAVTEIVNAAREAGIPWDLPKAAEDQLPSAAPRPSGPPK